MSPKFFPLSFYPISTLNITDFSDFQIDSEKDDFRLHVSKILRGNFTDPLSNIANSNNLQFNAIRPEGANLFSCLDRVHMG